MPRLPVPGSDDGTWGHILNDYLSSGHKADGTHKTLPLTQGGTGATDPTTARTNLGLGNVDNTSDPDKPVSTATQAALDTLKQQGLFSARPAAGNQGATYYATDKDRWYRDDGAAWKPISGPEVFNVKDYGAVGDGVADDTAAIQAAIDAAGSGDIVFFPGGTYLVSATLGFPSGITIEGSTRDHSAGSVVKLANGAAVDAVFASKGWLANSTGTGGPVVIRDLTVHGNSTNGATGRGIILQNWRSLVHDVQVRNTSGDGIYLPSTTANGSVIASTQVEDIISHCVVSNVGGHGIHVPNADSKVTDGLITACIIHGTAGNGIHIASSGGWDVEGNHLYGIGGHGIVATFGWDIHIIGNSVQGFGVGAAAATRRGITLSSMVNGSPGVVIANNLLHTTEPVAGSTYQGIFVGAGLNQTDVHALVVGNYVGAKDAGLTTAFVFTDSGGGVQHTHLTGNSTAGCAQNLSYGGTAPQVTYAGNAFQFSTDEPAAKWWPAGIVVQHSDAAAGEPFAWVCTVAGTPGTWAETFPIEHSDRHRLAKQLDVVNAFVGVRRGASGVTTEEVAVNLVHRDDGPNAGSSIDLRMGFGNSELSGLSAKYALIRAVKTAAWANGTNLELHGGTVGAPVRGLTVVSDGSVRIDRTLDHDGAAVGFYGATPVAKPTALTAADASAVDATYGTEEANVINNLRTRVNELESKLRALGLLM